MPFSRQTMELSGYLGLEIRNERKLRNWTASQLAERAGVTRSTIDKIEQGSPSVKFGTVLEVAHLVGFSFIAPTNDLAHLLRSAKERDALLPERVRLERLAVDDDF